MRLTWDTPGDPDSGIFRYNLYRDGRMLGESYASTTQFDDGGYTVGSTHVYQVRALNGAFNESDACPTLAFSTTAGDANGDGLLDPADIFYLVNYLLADGPPPFGDADANGDGTVTVTDIFYLINFHFAGGPAPFLIFGGEVRTPWTDESRATTKEPETSESTAPQARTRLVVGSARAAPGGTVRLPIDLVDREGTPLGPDRPFGERVQALSLAVACSPCDGIASLAVEPAGSLAHFEPLFEARPARPGTRRARRLLRRELGATLRRCDRQGRRPAGGLRSSSSSRRPRRAARCTRCGSIPAPRYSPIRPVPSRRPSPTAGSSSPTDGSPPRPRNPAVAVRLRSALAPLLPSREIAMSILVRSRRALVLLLAGTGFAALAPPLAAQSYTVTTLADSGAGSLRDAMDFANADGVPTAITFAPGLAGGTIALASPLPSFSEDGTTIDGDGDGRLHPGDRHRHVRRPRPADTADLDGVESGPRTCALRPPQLARHRPRPARARTTTSSSATGWAKTSTAIPSATATPRWRSTSGAHDNRIGPGNHVAHTATFGIRIAESSVPGYPNLDALTPDLVTVAPIVDLHDDCGVLTRRRLGASLADSGGHPFIENFGVRLTGTLGISVAGTYSFTIDLGLGDGDPVRLTVAGDTLIDWPGGGSPPPASLTLSPGSHSLRLEYQEGGGQATLALATSGPAATTLSTTGNSGRLRRRPGGALRPALPVARPHRAQSRHAEPRSAATPGRGSPSTAAVAPTSTIRGTRTSAPTRCSIIPKSPG